MRGNQKMTSITPKVEDLLDLKWKVALVTGASAGIGRGVALRRAEAGASVAAHYRNDREAADVVVASVRDRKHRGSRRLGGTHGLRIRRAGKSGRVGGTWPIGEVRKALRPLAGVRPDFRRAERWGMSAARGSSSPNARRPRLRRLSDAWRYLAGRDSRRPAPR